MKRYVVLTGLLLAASPVALSAAGADASPARVLSWDAGSVTVEIVIPPPVVTFFGTAGRIPISSVAIAGFPNLTIEGELRLPARRFIVEVPGLEGVEMSVLAEERITLPGVRPSVYFANGSLDAMRAALERAGAPSPHPFAELGRTGTYRGRHIASINVRPAVFDPAMPGLHVASRLVVRIAFPPPKGMLGGPGSRAPLDFALNAAQGAAWSGAAALGKGAPGVRAAEESFAFSRSGSWVRIPIRERGVYMIAYNDLLIAGVSPAQVDPATVRIFSTPPLAEPDDMAEGGSFSPSYDLTEHPILVRGGTAGEFTPADTIVFYAVGCDGWADEIDPSKNAFLYRKHLYATENVYWMTWGGAFDDPPKRFAARTVTPVGAPGTIDIASYEERVRRERDEIYDPIYSDDRWFWRLLKSGATASFSDTFSCSDLVGTGGVVRGMTSGPYSDNAHLTSTAYYRLNGVSIGSATWLKVPGYNPSAWAQFQAAVTNLASGRNVLQITKATEDQFYTHWYEISYERQLKARSGTLEFHAPDTSATARFAISGFPSGAVYLFDITRYDSVVSLSGAQIASGSVTFEDALDRSPRHYLAVSRSSLKRASLDFGAVPSLRDEPGCPDMLIIYHERFRDAAFALRDLHGRGLPGITSPVVRAVSVGDVYANFSGGRKDPIAFRNYFKYLYDRSACAAGGEPSLRYALFVGNGTYDPRDNIGKGNDLVPLYLNIWGEGSSEACEDEDFLVSLDLSEDNVPDIAVGRMPVLNEQDAIGWARRIASYRDDPEPGAWRNKIILVADDLHHSGAPGEGRAEKDHMETTESLSIPSGPLPRFLDFKKIFLQNYPFEGDTKPTAKKEFLGEWNEGALIVQFIGHGSPLQMADERVMLNSDIYSLSNGNRRPLFLAFSCSIGDIESPYQRSMAQNMLVFEEGGAISTICAAAPTYSAPNGMLNHAIYEQLFVSKDSTGTNPFGVALQRAKIFGSGWASNDSKYLLLGDPALVLAAPRQLCTLETAPIDTMSTGYRYRLDGAVTVGGAVDASFTGSADIIVQEAERRYEVIADTTVAPQYQDTIRWGIPGKELFRGSVDVTAGAFRAEFTVPRVCHVGPHARVRVYAEAGAKDAIGAVDTLTIVAATIPPNPAPPRINMYFAGQATKVKAGARLIAELSDPDGIAILGTNPQNSIFLEFDGSGYPVYVTEFFTYDHGSSTSGRVEYPLQAAFEAGKHRVYIRAFDNLGASTADTLDFELVEEGLFAVTDVFAFPNPFTEVTNIVYQLTSGADVTARVFTLSGVEIWKRQGLGEEGFNSVVWDGRDAAGDRVANGTYLYALEVDFKESPTRAETVKGKVVLLR